MIVPSYFESLAESQNLQFMIDQSQDVLDAQSIWRVWLDLGVAQMSLDFNSVIGRDRISAAASIVDTDSSAPLRSRDKLERYSGKIPAMKMAFALRQDDMRAIEVLRALPLNGGLSDAQLIAFLNKDLAEASVAGDKRVDLMFLQALSTLTVDLTTTSNPDGAALGTIDLLPQTYQKQGVNTVWTDAANATPLDDIQTFVETMTNLRGRKFGHILLSFELWITFRKTTQVKSYLATFFNVGKANTAFAVTIANVNEYLVANLLPPITIVNYTTMIESDGLPSFVKGFNTNNLVFAPAGKLGILANAIPMERLHPVEGKTYADYGPTLVGKWAETNPLVEYTGMEMLAFPVLNVDGIFLMQTNVVQAGNFV